MDSSHLSPTNFSLPPLPLTRGEEKAAVEKFSPALAKEKSTLPSCPPIKVISHPTPAKNSISLPKAQVPSFTSLHRREMSFSPHGPIVETPRVEDVMPLVSNLKNIKLTPIDHQDTSEQSTSLWNQDISKHPPKKFTLAPINPKSSLLQRRKSFMLHNFSSPSPAPSSDTASISSLSTDASDEI